MYVYMYMYICIYNKITKYQYSIILTYESHFLRLESNPFSPIMGNLDFPYIGNFPLPTDFHIFPRGWRDSTTNQWH